MKLTIGMAAFDDFDGVYFTVQALKMYHPEVAKQIELIVVDNKPDTKGSGFIKNLLDGWSKNLAGARYIPMSSPQGTTQSRNRIFADATGDAVLCMDSHVLIAPGAIAKLIAYYEQNPTTTDLLSGPMLYDDLKAGNTHFDDYWRSEMWGIWGKAWACSCFPSKDALKFSVLNSDNKCDFRHLGMGLTPVSSCSCGRQLPELPYPQHEAKLREAGFIELAEQDQPFEIPGMGLGLFTCRRDAWLGFNPLFRGFGGEEMYIHEKYRQHGSKALCLPFLKWGHRFGRPNGVPYVAILTRWNKIRNYVLGANELGIPLDRIKNHFVDSGMMPQWEWERLISNPEALEVGPGMPPPGTVLPPREQGRPQPRATIATEGELIAWARTIKRDLDQHLDKLSEYAAKCDHVTEITHRRESTVGLLPAKKLVSYQAEDDPLLPKLVNLFPGKIELKPFNLSDDMPIIGDTDLLFIDTIHTAKRLLAELKTYSPHVRKYIIMHDTQLHAERGQDGGPGMLVALRQFMKDQPEWSVIYHTKEQYGLTIITKLADEKPKLPSILKMAANFAVSAAAYTTDGMTNVTKEVYDERLGICSICEQRNENSCSVCGCGLAAKAAGRAFECPLGKWPTQEKK